MSLLNAGGTVEAIDFHPTHTNDLLHYRFGMRNQLLL
jgi:hypothetical protein